jgi:hypothetical protein
MSKKKTWRDDVDWAEAGRKSWITRRANERRAKRVAAAHKAWATRTANG